MNDTFQKNTESKEAVMIRRNLEAISKEMYISKVKKIEKNIQRLQDMQYIFNQNYDELINHIDKFQNDEFVNKLDNNISRLEIHQKTIRYLFNYLSSAVSMLYHIEQLVNNNKQNNFGKKANETLKQIIPYGYNKFIKKIRHHLIHRDIINVSLEYDNEIIINGFCKRTIVLNLIDRRYYEEFWNDKDISPYLIKYSTSTGVVIGKFSCDYNNKINNYLDRFIPAFKEYHKDDYEYYHQLETEYINLSAEYSKLISE